MSSRDDRARGPSRVGEVLFVAVVSGAELYDLENDPDELLNLAHTDSSLAAAMSGELARIVHGWSGGEPPEPDEETREKLRALGYVH